MRPNVSLVFQGKSESGSSSKISTRLPPALGWAPAVVPPVLAVGPQAASREINRSDPPTSMPIDCQRCNTFILDILLDILSRIVPRLLLSDDERARNSMPARMNVMNSAHPVGRACRGQAPQNPRMGEPRRYTCTFTEILHEF